MRLFRATPTMMGPTMMGPTMMGPTMMALAFIALLVASQPARCDVVFSTFEEPALAAGLNSDGAFEGVPETASSFRSGNITFDNNGVVFSGTTWTGFGYAQRGALGAGQQFYDNSNDLISKPATGAPAIPGPGPSPTWGVVSSGGVMTADAGYRFEALSLTNTLYAWDAMANFNPFSGPAFTNGGGTGRYAGQDDFFTVRFQNTASAAFLDFNLADYRGAVDYIVENWQTFDLSSLQASQLSISFYGSRETNFIPPPDPPIYFLDTPSYLAVDNIAVSSIAAVPEPSSLALLGASAAVGAWLRIRRRRARSISTQ